VAAARNHPRPPPFLLVKPLPDVESLMTQTAVDRLDWDGLPLDPARIFDVWIDGSELAWARHAWSVLAEAGLTDADDEVERITAVVRLLALAAIYRDFCARAFEEGTVGDWREGLPWELLDQSAGFDRFSLGQLAGRLNITTARRDAHDNDALSEIVADLIEIEWRTVTGRLLHAWGESALFAGLVASSQAAVGFPLGADELNAALNTDLTGGKQAAYSWVAEGLPA
jgi:hypothetical protein